MEKSEIYRDQYRDVDFSISKFKAFSHSLNSASWAHYIHLNLDKQIKDKSIADKLWLTPEYDDKNRVSYSYYSSIIAEIEFHGGCTWYSKESSPDEKDRIIKIGCDYQHSWDEGKFYDVQYIERQAKESIDTLLKIVPVLKWCNGCGAYYEDVKKNGCGKCQYSHDKY